MLAMAGLSLLLVDLIAAVRVSDGRMVEVSFKSGFQVELFLVVAIFFSIFGVSCCSVDDSVWREGEGVGRGMDSYSTVCS